MYIIVLYKFILLVYYTNLSVYQSLDTSISDSGRDNPDGSDPDKKGDDSWNWRQRHPNSF